VAEKLHLTQSCDPTQLATVGLHNLEGTEEEWTAWSEELHTPVSLLPGTGLPVSGGPGQGSRVPVTLNAVRSGTPLVCAPLLAWCVSVESGWEVQFRASPPAACTCHQA
jgi:hypothetical protein